MRRWSLALALGGLAAGFAGFAWLWAPADAPRAPIAAAAETSDDAPAATVDAPTADAATLPGAATMPPDDGANADQARDAIGPASPMGPAVTVQVVRSPAQTPVPGAELFLLPEARGAEAQQQAKTELSACEWPERFGQRLFTDERGTARLPPVREPWLVAARAGDEFAFARITPARGDRTVTLELAGDETVALVVVTADGAPAPAVPVAVLWHRTGEDQPAVLWRAHTDRSGQAWCRHFQVLRPAPAGGPAEQAAAMLALPLQSPVVQVFPGRPAPRTPLRLLVPARTAVAVQLTDHRGAPLLSPASVALWLDRPKDLALPLPLPAAIDRPRLDKPVGAEPVVFAPVGANTELRVGARYPNERKGAVSPPLFLAPGDGSTPPPIPLALPSELALLAGTLATTDRQPVGGAKVAAAIWRADGPLAQVVVHTIADGRFDLVLQPPPGSPEFWLDLRWNGDPPPPGDGPPSELGARVWFRALAAGERRELGTIVLGPLPPLCAGVVVDDQGQPVANAEVKLQQKRPEPPAPAPGQRPAGQEPPDPWRDLPLLLTRTDAEGRFQLGGELPNGELRVRADTDQHFADSAPLRAPGQHLRITLQRNGVLRGRVLLPEWLGDGVASLTLRPFDAAAQARDTRTVPLARRRGGWFAVEPLRPGRYDAQVTVRNLAEPLCTIADLFVPPGPLRDPRFQPLDLRQSLFRYRLRAVDFGGNPLPLDGPILARLRKSDGTVTEAGFRWQKGRAEIIAASALADIVAFGKGCAPTAVTLLPGDHDVFLQRVAPALVMLPGCRALCGPTRRVRVSAILTEETGLPQWLQGQDQRTGEAFTFPRWELGKSNGAWLGASDTVEVPVVKSGKYEVVLRVHATDSENSPQVAVALGVHELFVDAGYTAVTRVPIDEAKVRQAIAQVEGQQARSNRRAR